MVLFVIAGNCKLFEPNTIFTLGFSFTFLGASKNTMYVHKDTYCTEKYTLYIQIYLNPKYNGVQKRCQVQIPV